MSMTPERITELRKCDTLKDELFMSPEEFRELCDLALKSLEAAEKDASHIIALAREFSQHHTRNMPDDDPNKGIGNWMADAIDAYDAARRGEEGGR